MSFAVLDWRREVVEIYRSIRRTDDARAAHAFWRERRDELFATHPASPLSSEERRDFAGLAYGDYDPAKRFELVVETDIEPRTRDVDTGTDGQVRFERLGRIDLSGLGTLDVWWLSSYGGGIFLPVADASPTSYRGGRYVLDTVKGADLGGDFDTASGTGTLVVDLNFAYNPSCAYDEGWACPLPGEGNRVAVPLECGERRLQEPDAA